MRPRSLRSLLDSAGLTATELARRVGVSRQAVSRWIARLDRPTPARIIVLAGVLGVTRERLDRFLAPTARLGRPPIH